MSATAKEVIRKYLKKVKPLYEKLSQKQQQKMAGVNPMPTAPISSVSFSMKSERSDDSNKNASKESNRGFSHSFSGNLRYPRRRSCISSCPSSMRSSPSHSGVLCRNGFVGSGTGSRVGGGMYYADNSSMEELQSAIQETAHMSSLPHTNLRGPLSLAHGDLSFPRL
ncbi:hypothetical protein GH714_019656 [Hevea brasiliensis]|uniref:Uncharacterized protein n=1 Tax=Hevea brasiliensis TaxID=3981 RepID=A0A6A6K5T6_HEVBR|nr:hypothetical protein GH714_019656 [Hevea brasiliensis]